MAWTFERVEMLTILWKKGKSASQIAMDLGDGVSRNAVIGKIHRLGLSERSGTSKNTPRKNSRKILTGSNNIANKDLTRKNYSENLKAKANLNKDKVKERDKKSKQQDRLKTSVESKNEEMLGFSMAEGEDISVEKKLSSELDNEALVSMLELEKKARKLNLMELTERTCKWPIGDPSTTDFWFCGHQAENGKPYCETHVSIAFQPVSPRREKKR